jgi:ATP-dependent metalloprotease FtsH
MSVSIADLVSKLRGLRSELLTKVFGQDHAVHAFVEGAYNAEVTASADRERKQPAAVFVFAGPPGVGKTYMAELCTSYLERPFKRYDMTGYSDHQAHNQLVGFSPSYKGAQPGTLTGFVEKNPNSILLFDEIEKAHLTTIQLFYQILDVGHLEDKYTESNVSFRDTIIIFTTNAGRSLYDNPNKIGISAANSNYHKRTILSALENEKNPADGRPAFPQALCSRLAQGYAVMFNHLGINELERVCAAELLRTEALLERQYFKNISHDPILPISLVFREGGRVDARQLRAETEKFVKGELFKYYSLYTQEKLEEAFEKVDSIRFEIEGSLKTLDPEVYSLFESPDKPKVLLVANTTFTELCQDHVPEIDWLSSTSAPEIIDILSTEDVDMVLLDIWIRRDINDSGIWSKTMDQDLDFTPLSARALDHGREILRKIHERSPQTPTYLLSFSDPGFGSGSSDERSKSIVDETPRSPIDDELFLACVRAGGTRGILMTSFMGTVGGNWETHQHQFAKSLLEINRRIYREKKARSLARERKVLKFETAAEMKKEERELRIRLRGFSFARAIDAMDAGELVNDVERPNTRFEDVFGARGAKESLQFVIDWLKNPKRYAAMGIRPPKGILMTGPPGTGKTMLARAVAGESNCAFIEKSASSFVTIWQGSGPQNVRDLFGRARRYAPSIVFIDELDAIGIKRSGGAGGGRAEEEALNAMLTEMDGFRAGTQQPVIVLAATNLADRLDEALKRRFDRTIEVDRPDKAARLQYLEKTVLERKNSEVTRTAIDRLAGQTARLTIADLERIVQQAAVMAAQNVSPMTDEILAEAYDRFRMGEARGEPVDKDALRRTAQHESGHALISWLCGKPPVRLTVVGRSNALGFMEHESEEDKGSYTKSELEQMICISMAGRAAEILYYGEKGGLDTGVSGDLKTATHWAIRMVTEFGMCKELGQVSLRDTYYERSTDGPLAVKVTKSAEQIVKQQLDKAIEILKENRSYLDKMVEDVLEKNTLYKEDLEKILPPLAGKREQ